VAWYEIESSAQHRAKGGHNSIGYFVEEYTTVQSIQFRFTNPKGFNGFHRYEIVKSAQQSVLLRHTIEMTRKGFAFLTWPIIIRPLHDALLEDSLATAQALPGKIP
jgi:hypothetical protein